MQAGHIEFTLSRAMRTLSGVGAAGVSTQRLDLAGFKTAASLPHVQRDFELLTGLLKQHPKEMAEVVDCVLAGKMGRAHELAAKIGLTEKSFVAKGGGLPWVIIAIAVGCLFLEHD